MKDKDIRTVIPFLIVLSATFFLSGADPFEDFGTRLDMLKKNAKLLWLMITGDGLQSIASFVIAGVLFSAWHKNRLKPFWFNDLLWQLAGAFACWAIACIISIVGTFWLYLWLNGMFRLFAGIFMLYVANTVVAAKNKLYHPETPQESLLKAQKFDELMKMINNGE